MGYIDGGLGKHGQGIVNPMEPNMKPMIGYFETSSPNASPPNPSITNMKEIYPTPYATSLDDLSMLDSNLTLILMDHILHLWFNQH